MNYATIKAVDVANGPGIRVSLFVSGCTHGCKGCFNEEAWDFQYGEPYNQEIEAQILTLLDREYVTGLSLLGGEPLDPQNQADVLALLKMVRLRFPQKTIWCYSGYKFETILNKMMPSSETLQALMEHLDILVDGPFIEAEKDLNIRFRGSRNQRILDVARSLDRQEAIWCEAFI